MRIIRGEFKGKKLQLPKDQNTRPLRDIVKESIFNLIEHSSKIQINIEDSIILDLFSGSGSFGLECLSRKAKRVIFFENYLKAVDILNRNIKSLKKTNNCEVFFQNCFDFFNSNTKFNEKFDIIFIDPPFKERRINELLENIIKKKILKPKGIIILHRHKKDDIKLTEKLKTFENRLYGISRIYFGF